MMKIRINHRTWNRTTDCLFVKCRKREKEGSIGVSIPIGISHYLIALVKQPIQSNQSDGRSEGTGVESYRKRDRRRTSDLVGGDVSRGGAMEVAQVRLNYRVWQ